MSLFQGRGALHPAGGHPSRLQPRHHPTKIIIKKSCSRVSTPEQRRQYFCNCSISPVPPNLMEHKDYEAQSNKKACCSTCGVQIYKTNFMTARLRHRNNKYAPINRSSAMLQEKIKQYSSPEWQHQQQLLHLDLQLCLAACQRSPAPFLGPIKAHKKRQQVAH